MKIIIFLGALFLPCISMHAADDQSVEPFTKAIALQDLEERDPIEIKQVFMNCMQVKAGLQTPSIWQQELEQLTGKEWHEISEEEQQNLLKRWQTRWNEQPEIAVKLWRKSAERKTLSAAVETLRSFRKNFEEKRETKKTLSVDVSEYLLLDGYVSDDEEGDTEKELRNRTFHEKFNSITITEKQLKKTKTDLKEQINKLAMEITDLTKKKKYKTEKEHSLAARSTHLELTEMALACLPGLATYYTQRMKGLKIKAEKLLQDQSIPTERKKEITKNLGYLNTDLGKALGQYNPLSLAGLAWNVLSIPPQPKV